MTALKEMTLKEVLAPYEEKLLKGDITATEYKEMKQHHTEAITKLRNSKLAIYIEEEKVGHIKDSCIKKTELITKEVELKDYLNAIAEEIQEDTYIDKQVSAYVVYQLALSKNGKLYVGYTNDLTRRLGQHRNKGRAYTEYKILFQTDIELLAKEAEEFFIQLTYNDNDNKIVTGKKARLLLAKMDRLSVDKVKYIEEEIDNLQADVAVKQSEIEEILADITKIEESIESLSEDLAILDS